MPAASSPLRAEVRILREQVEDVLRDFFGPDELEWADQLPARVRIALDEMYRQRGEWISKFGRAVTRLREAEERITELMLDLDTSVGASLRPVQDDSAGAQGCRTGQHDAADAAVNLLSAAVPAASVKPGNAPTSNAATPPTVATEPTTATGSAPPSSPTTRGACSAANEPPSPITIPAPAKTWSRQETTPTTPNLVAACASPATTSTPPKPSPATASARTNEQDQQSAGLVEQVLDSDALPALDKFRAVTVTREVAAWLRDTPTGHVVRIHEQLRSLPMEFTASLVSLVIADDHDGACTTLLKPVHGGVVARQQIAADRSGQSGT